MLAAAFFGLGAGYTAHRFVHRREFIDFAIFTMCITNIVQQLTEAVFG